MVRGFAVRNIIFHRTICSDMPYKTEKVKFDCPFLDRRTKLLPCQREMMLYWHNEGLSQRKLASMFGVSRRLVIFTCHPEKKKKNVEARNDRGGSKIYYKGGKEWAETMKKHRYYKHNTLKDTI
jgi:hypothetical protein